MPSSTNTVEEVEEVESVERSRLLEGVLTNKKGGWRSVIVENVRRQMNVPDGISWQRYCDRSSARGDSLR